MPADLDLGLTLAELDELAKHDASSRLIPEGPIEIVVDAQTPEKGFLRLAVKGFETEEGRELRSAFYGYYASFGDLLEHQAKRRSDLNPEQDPALDLLASAQLNATLGAPLRKAEAGLVQAAREVVRRGLTGYQAGEIKSGGVSVPWQLETVTIDGKKRKVAHPRILEVLRRSGLLLAVASAILEFSETGEYPSAAEQFQVAAQTEQEAAQALGNFLLAATKTASPFLSAPPKDATPDTQESSLVDSASPSPCASTSASESETKSPATL